MRLLRFYIHEHRVLSQLDLRFDPGAPVENEERNYHLDFLVGVNGTGKSTVLRLLGRVFRQSFAELRDLPFILEYYRERDGQTIRIANIRPDTKEALERFSITRADGLHADLDAQTPQESDAIAMDLLPQRIIAYTTGSEQAWLAQEMEAPVADSAAEDIGALDATERAIREMPGRMPPRPTALDEVNDGRFRLVRQTHLPLVALCGLALHGASGGASTLSDALQEAGIAGLAGLSLDFDLADATDNDRADIFSLKASHAVWNSGKLRLVFLQDKLEELLRARNGALGLFEFLADLHGRAQPVLIKAHLFLKRAAKAQDDETRPHLHLWEWLSDGEQGFIGRMCLFTLFGEVESLIMLDEPEVHFNDYWKRHIVNHLHRIFQQKASGNRSHVLIATHSSISLSDVPKDDILVLKRAGSLTSEMTLPRVQTFGADPGDIMVHVFETPYATGAHSVEEIEGWLRSAYEQPIGSRRQYLEERLKRVPPGYWAYRIRREIRALAAQ